MTMWVMLQDPNLWFKISEQLYLVGISVSLAVITGIPLGVFATTVPAVKRYILGASAILWTIPSLALFACLMPFTGIGKATAIIGLTGYALLPIVRATVDGIENLSSDIDEASHSLGLRYTQHLLLIGLPLAMPAIVSGIKVAVVMCVGMATLATFIGAGGLGDFINQGLATGNYDTVLKGAVPSALLAVGLDAIMTKIEKKLGQSQHALHAYAILACIGGLFVLLLMPWVGYQNWRYHTTPKLVFASKPFTEQYVLLELMAQMVEHHLPVRVERKFNLGTTDICHQALLREQIDLYPEYTGTAYLNVLKETHQVWTPHALFEYVAKEYDKKFKLVWLEPFPFNNSNVLVVNKRWSAQERIKSIGDLAQSSLVMIAAPPEAIERADALPGLKKHYQLEFSAIKSLIPPMGYQALRQQSVDVNIGFATDSQLQDERWLVLEDSEHFFMAYQAAPVVHRKLLKHYPQLLVVLAKLSKRVDLATIRRLNYAVDSSEDTLVQVAHKFLKEQELIS